MKRVLFLISVAIIILGLAARALFLSKGKSSSPPPPPLPEAVNTVGLQDRPYAVLTPVLGKHPPGTEVALTVYTTTLGATSAEYELEYQAGSLLQGAFGSLDLDAAALPVTKTLLLGTCSAGGKCDYNRDVAGGTLLLRLKGGSQKFAVKGEWSFQLMSERQGQFSSRDSKFRLDVGQQGLPPATAVIISQTLGLPALTEGREVIAGPYHIAALAKPPKSAQVSIRLPQETAAASLLAWNGSQWRELEATVAEKTLTAAIDSFTTFVVVAPPAAR